MTGAQKQLKQLKHEQQQPVVDSAPYVHTDAVWMGRWGWVCGTVCGMDAALRAYMDVLAAGPGNPSPPAHFQAIHILLCF